jgi:hypothetical protein
LQAKLMITTIDTTMGITIRATPVFLNLSL